MSRRPRPDNARYGVLDTTVIRDRRLYLRLSAEVLGDMLGVSGGAINYLEHGGEQQHLSVAFIVDLAAALGLVVADLLIAPVAACEGDLVEPEDPATVGRIVAEVGTVHVDDLAGGLGWTTGRVLYALTVLEDRLPTVGQRLSWLADSQVTVIHAPGDPAPVGPVTRRTITAWGLNSDEVALLEWVARKGGHRALGQEVNPVAVQRLKAAGLLTEAVIHTPRANPGVRGAEQLRLTDEAAYNLCLD